MRNPVRRRRVLSYAAVPRPRRFCRRQPTPGRTSRSGWSCRSRRRAGRISSPVSWPSACRPGSANRWSSRTSRAPPATSAAMQVARAKPDGHHAHVVGQHAGDECQPVPQPALRSRCRFRAAEPQRLGHAGAGRPSRRSRRHARGDDRRSPRIARKSLRPTPARASARRIISRWRFLRRRRASSWMHVPYKGSAGAVQDLLWRPDRLHVPARARRCALHQEPAS